MSDAGSISMLLAVIDLAVVKSITGAMRAADAASGKPAAATKLGPAPNPMVSCGNRNDSYEPRRVFHPTPRIEPRRVIHPEARIEARRVFHPTPRIEGEFVKPSAQPAPMKLGATEAVWKKVPWKNHTPAPQVIKVIKKVHDKDQRGQMLDLFI